MEILIRNKIQFDEHESKDIIYKYESLNYTVACIANLYNVSIDTIRRYLKLHSKEYVINCKTKRDYRKYTINHDYFNTIDTEDKSYFLGFMYADGNVSITTDVSKINLEEDDSYILNIFANKINTNKPLIFAKLSTESNNLKNQKSLVIHSKQIKEDLIKLGCVPKKSLILQFPTEEQVPKEFQRHFIRGYFDGDGCITISKNGQSFISFVSTQEFLNTLQQILNKDLNLKNTKLYQPTVQNTHILRFCGNNSAKKLFKYLYNDTTEILRLSRKYDKFLYLNNSPSTLVLNRNKQILRDYSRGVRIKDLCLIYTLSRTTIHDVIKKHKNNSPILNIKLPQHE